MDQNPSQHLDALPVNNEVEQKHDTGDKSKKIITFKTPLAQPVQLHTSENAWKPYYKVIEQTVEEKEKLRRRVQAVLNKLTFQKLRILLEQLQKLKIVTEDEMNLIVDLVYEHAVYEPRFSIVYANLCKCFDLNIMSTNDQSVKEIKFSTLLLTKCHNEFEEGFKKFSEIGAKDQKTLHQLEKDRKDVKAKRIGNIRFIGELYKTSMISSSVLQEYIENLLRHGDEISLECFFWLIKTVGNQLDTLGVSQGKDHVEEYFEKIQQIVNDRTTSSRIRFLLQDVIDLKQNKWIPRRIENIPRTIDEIHEEAAFEAYEQLKRCPKKMYNARRSNRMGANACVCKKKSSLPPRNRKGALSNIEPSNTELANESRGTFLGEEEKDQTNVVEDSVINKSQDKLDEFNPSGLS